MNNDLIFALTGLCWMIIIYLTSYIENRKPISKIEYPEIDFSKIDEERNRRFQQQVFNLVMSRRNTHES
jgi:hypothetical protein